MKVVVYGTLKKDGKLHHNMERINAIFVKEAILKDHEMYNLGWFPAIIEAKGSNVKVEVYEIEEDKLDVLDFIEGYPNLYQRKETEFGQVYYMADPIVVYGCKKVLDGNWDVNKM